MKLPSDLAEEYLKKKINTLTLINGLLGFAYIAIAVWILAEAVRFFL